MNLLTKFLFAAGAFGVYRLSRLSNAGDSLQIDPKEVRFKRRDGMNLEFEFVIQANNPTSFPLKLNNLNLTVSIADARLAQVTAGPSQLGGGVPIPAYSLTPLKIPFSVLIPSAVVTLGATTVSLLGSSQGATNVTVKGPITVNGITTSVDETIPLKK